MLQHAFCIHLILLTCRTNTFGLPSNGSNSNESTKSKAVQSIEFSFVFTHFIRIILFRYNLIGNTIISLILRPTSHCLTICEHIFWIEANLFVEKCINVPKWGINAHQILFWIFHTRQINSPNFMIFDLARLVNSNSFTMKFYRSEIQSIPNKMDFKRQIYSAYFSLQIFTWLNANASLMTKNRIFIWNFSCIEWIGDKYRSTKNYHILTIST